MSTTNTETPTEEANDVKDRMFAGDESFPRWWMTSTLQIYLRQIKEVRSTLQTNHTHTHTQQLLMLESIYRKCCHQAVTASPSATAALRGMVAYEILRVAAPLMTPFHDVLINAVSEIPAALYTTPTDPSKPCWMESFNVLRNHFQTEIARYNSIESRNSQNTTVLKRTLEMWGQDSLARHFRAWHAIAQRHKSLRDRYRRYFSTSSLRMSVLRALGVWKRYAAGKYVMMKASTARGIRENKLTTLRKDVTDVQESIEDMKRIITSTIEAKESHENQARELAAENEKCRGTLEGLLKEIKSENDKAGVLLRDATFALPMMSMPQDACSLSQWISFVFRSCTTTALVINRELLFHSESTLNSALAGTLPTKFLDPLCFVHLLHAFDSKRVPIERVHQISGMYDLRAKAESCLGLYKECTGFDAPILPQELLRCSQRRLQLSLQLLFLRWVSKSSSSTTLLQPPNGENTTTPFQSCEDWTQTLSRAQTKANSTMLSFDTDFVDTMSALFIEIDGHEENDGDGGGGGESGTSSQLTNSHAVTPPDHTSLKPPTGPVNSEKMIRRAFSEIEQHILDTISPALLSIPVSVALKENYKMLQRAYQKYARSDMSRSVSQVLTLKGRSALMLDLPFISFEEVGTCLFHASLIPPPPNEKYVADLSVLYDDIVGGEEGMAPHVGAFVCCFLMTCIWKYGPKEGGPLDTMALVRQGAGDIANVLLDTAAVRFQAEVVSVGVDAVLSKYTTMLQSIFEEQVRESDMEDPALQSPKHTTGSDQTDDLPTTAMHVTQNTPPEGISERQFRHMCHDMFDHGHVPVHSKQLFEM